jgi:hypothetical protein
LLRFFGNFTLANLSCCLVVASARPVLWKHFL